jgi:hypothetical protein
VVSKPALRARRLPSCPYSPRIREEFFSETGLPTYRVLENGVSEKLRSSRKLASSNLRSHLVDPKPTIRQTKIKFEKKVKSLLTQPVVVGIINAATDCAGVTPGTHATVGGKGLASEGGYGKLRCPYRAACLL